jgi:hypothetical protein
MTISAHRTGQVNTSAFEGRLNASSASKALENFKSNGTNKLIEECVIFMRDNSNRKDSEQLVKYMMGKTKQMPSHFKAACSAMPKETQSMLRDLLRTERFGFKKESFEKTLAKLEAMDNKLKDNQANESTKKLESKKPFLEGLAQKLTNKKPFDDYELVPND